MHPFCRLDIRDALTEANPYTARRILFHDSATTGTYRLVCGVFSV